MRALTIPGRFNGPPGSGNGGVTCGLLATATGLSQVTLRQPPPLDVALEVRSGELYDGDQLVATAAAADVTVTSIAPVSLADAKAATASYPGWKDHPFPTCFVCGPDHPSGLRVFPGPVADGVVAAPWTPADDDPVMVWAALDCPSGWSHDIPGRPMVLGRMTCRIDRLPEPGQETVAMGWRLGEDGRKCFTASGLFTGSGELLALAEQTWVVLQR
jgi:hypothetical protein